MLLKSRAQQVEETTMKITEILTKLDFLACDYDTKFSNWQDAKLNRLAMKISAHPYTNTTFQIREKTTGKIIATNSTGYWNPRTRAEIDAKTTLRFTWNGLRSNNGNPGYYTLTFLDGGDKSTVKNVTDTEIKFAHLTPGKKYTLEGKECFTTVHCDILTTLEEWTEPEKPRVLEKTELQTTTDTTITIQLPVLQNPPGMHWILLRKYSGGGDEHHTRKQDTEEKALVMVRTEREKERKEAQARRRNSRSADPGENDHSLRIVAKIEVVEEKDPEELVVVGGDWHGGKGLESDTEYIVFIVTETRAGPYSGILLVQAKDYEDSETA
ncbi:uncharacterized protein LOC135098046 isoform X3 [Scylla paramamosain]|uniref:uncharacterized protein LOC135098046 isoform X3 n=1 Tax=Scylla paramamosain TaxID=85552 RepID=UPI00308278AD